MSVIAGEAVAATDQVHPPRWRLDDGSCAPGLTSEIVGTVFQMKPRQTHLLVLGHTAGLAWVLANERMAFNDNRLSQARKLEPGDGLLLYVTKAVFGNSGPKSGLIVGDATVRSKVHQPRQPVTVAEISYAHVVNFSLQGLAPLGEGVALSAHLDSLELFPDPRTWTSRIRRTVVPLPERDASFLSSLLAPVATEPIRVLEGYQELAAPIAMRRSEVASRKQAPTLHAPDDRSYLLDLLA
jgi:hypothetical protein